MRRFVLAIVATHGFAVALVASSAGQAPQPVPSSATAPPARTSAVLGRVLEAGTTNPVPNAVVTISGPELNIEPGPPGAPVTGSRRVAADSAGWFLFRNLPPGSFRLSAAAPGFVDGLFG